MPRKNRKGIKPLLVELSEELTNDLEAFCAANLGTAKARVVREAIRYYIDARIQGDPELRNRYHVAHTHPFSPQADALRVLKPKKVPE
jgi:hypothetical protein